MGGDEAPVAAAGFTEGLVSRLVGGGLLPRGGRPPPLTRGSDLVEELERTARA